MPGPAAEGQWIMEFSRYCRVLLLGVVLPSAGCLGQTPPVQMEIPAPSAVIELGGAVADASYCSTFSTADARLALISKFCEFALTYQRRLPDFIAQQTITARGAFSTKVITAQATFRQGRELFSNIAIDGKPVPSSGITDTLPGRMGFSSTGELGSFLVDLFSSAGVAEFKFRREDTLRGLPVAIYEFQIASAKNTFWTLRDSKGRPLRPEFRGELWLEQQTGRPLREELEPLHLPAGTGRFASVTTIIDYVMTPVGDAGVFLLPARSETHVCVQSIPVTRMDNVITFHEYRKFAATTRIMAVTR